MKNEGIPNYDWPLEGTRKRIIDAFSGSAGHYEEFADIQQLAAGQLIKSLRPWIDLVPRGPILEIGCGTGFVTRDLIRMFPHHEMVVTDISPAMLDRCRKNLESENLLSDKISFRALDGEKLDEVEHYALIVSGFTLQWYHDPMFGLYRMVDALVPAGLLLISFPGDRSFPEWKRYCEQLDIPYTGNRLPNKEKLAVQISMKPLLIDEFEEMYAQSYETAQDFFRSLKKIGAATPLPSGRRQPGKLSPAQLRRLIRYWNNKRPDGIQVNYNLVYIAGRKKG